MIWWFVMPLWTIEEGESDLSVELSLSKSDGQVTIVRDGIHALEAVCNLITAGKPGFGIPARGDECRRGNIVSGSWRRGIAPGSSVAGAAHPLPPSVVLPRRYTMSSVRPCSSFHSSQPLEAVPQTISDAALGLLKA